MRLLVTGGAGFIGSNFILYWLKHHPQDQVVNFDKLTYAGNLENLATVAGNPNYQFLQGDICDSISVTKAIKKIDTIVHFAAESHVDRSILDPSTFVKTNIFGTQVLLEATRKAKVSRFHHISTDEVYGSLKLGSQKKFSESSCYQPRSPYAASKAASDHLVRAYHITYGLPITISNCSNNYGPYQFPEKLIPLTITNLLENKKVPVYQPGNQVRDWLYVGDHCRALDLILNQGEVGETYCLGAQHQELTNLEVIKKIIKILGKDESSIEFVRDRPGHDQRYALDWTKIKQEFGWRPQHSFDDWLKKTVVWYQENQAWWQRVKSGEYRDYYQQQYGQR